MAYTLGLDIGISTIGWTLVEGDSQSIQTMGVHVYPNSSKNFDFGKREISKRTQRRLQRIIRFRYERKRTRKIVLLRLLSKHGLCPAQWADIQQWKKTKSFPHCVLDTWLRSNPYALRVKALEEPVSLMELGRILYHFFQRRGFPLSDRSLESARNILFKGYPPSNRLGISAIQPHLNDQFLGPYLAQLYPLPFQSYTHTDERIRNRFLPRSAYYNEAHAIWAIQKEHHPELNDTLKQQLIGDYVEGKQIKGAVFYQRPLKSQKHRVGSCMFEPHKTKCCVSSLTYQKVLTYRWVNTIKKDGRPLLDVEREQVAHYFLTHRKFTFQAIIDLLAEPEALYNKKSDELIVGSFVHSELSKAHYFGSKWFAFDEKTQEDIWHVMYFFKDKKKVAEYAHQHWGFSLQNAQSLSRISIDKRYAPISRKAAKNILYFLKRGVTYDLAVVLGGVKNSLSKHWDGIAEKDIRFIISKVIELYHSHSKSGFTHQLQEFLMAYLQLNTFHISKLYGKNARIQEMPQQSQFEFSKEADEEVYRFHNPLLINTLFQCRKIINSIVDTYGPLSQIKIQMDPKLKANKYQRYFTKLDARRVSHNRDQYIKKIGSLRENVTLANVLKYELWEECKHTCPYTGDPIPLERLFTQDFKIVYIHPWSRSLKDSTLNKTLCAARVHDDLKEMTPYEYFMDKRAYDWYEVVARAAKLFSNTKEFPTSFNKFRRFVKRYYRRDILKHHIQDPSFISQELRCYFTQVCPDVTVAPSYSTTHLIEHWRLDKIIPYENLSDDYRYAALCAYVAAIRDWDILHELTHWDRYRRSPRKLFPEPAPNFRDAVEYHMNSIFFSFAQKKKIISRRKLSSSPHSKRHLGVAVRGMLHKVTIYSKRRAPNEMSHSYHIRKTLESFQSQGQVSKIVDPVIKEILENTIHLAGGYTNDRVPTSSLIGTDTRGFKQTKIFLPNKKGGDPVPVRSIRIKENFSGAVQLKPNQNKYVNPRKNHHILIYQDCEGNYQEDVVSFWEAIRRKSKGEPLYQLPKEKTTYIASLHANDLFLLGVSDLAENLQEESRSFLAKNLYRVQKLSSKFYEFRLAYHNDLREVQHPEFIRITNFGNRKTGWETLNPIKVFVYPAGQIIRAKPHLASITKNPSMLQ
ncbi:MAG: type II CRISPR RNA-guided endonuclease Cas9 [Flavobacteriaceae bacterium]